MIKVGDKGIINGHGQVGEIRIIHDGYCVFKPHNPSSTYVATYFLSLTQAQQAVDLYNFKQFYHDTRRNRSNSELVQEEPKLTRPGDKDKEG